jgi:hypothetical protein
MAGRVDFGDGCYVSLPPTPSSTSYLRPLVLAKLDPNTYSHSAHAYRASTATIIRIPYVHTLSDQADFLYATTDVAIWSCVETGVGIAAACCATLRPLFRTFLGHTRRQTGALAALPYPASVGGGHGKEGYGGYIRSPSCAVNEELGLRDRDVGK